MYVEQSSDKYKSPSMWLILTLKGQAVSAVSRVKYTYSSSKSHVRACNSSPLRVSAVKELLRVYLIQPPLEDRPVGTTGKVKQS